MASVWFTHVGYITSISPNTTHHWWWNNAPAQRVWMVSADALVQLQPIPPAPGASARVEVTRVEQWENYDGSKFEKEVHFWIKNTGTIPANYAIHLASIQE